MKSEITIRAATLEDAPAILKHLQDAYVERFPKNKMFVVDAEDAAHTIAVAIEGDEACALVASDDKGILLALAIGILAPWFLNFNFRTAATLAFWVAPAYRKGGVGARLAAALEAWAVKKNADAFVLGHTRGPFDSAMGRLCKRLGMHAEETSYMKKLGAA